MPSSFTNLLFHSIFSTTGREPFIDNEIAKELHPYLGGIVKSFNGVPLSIGGVSDHVHMLISLPATICIADAMRLVKTNSSKFIHERFARAAGFGWQVGYGAFTVSQSNVDAVRHYIATQEEHHKTITFQEEFIAFLKRHNVPYDERYIWQ